MEENNVFVGTIIWFDVKAGCGFIQPDEGRSEIFARLVPKRGEKEQVVLASGDRVVYEIVAREAIIQNKC